MANNETKTNAEIYREQRKARLAKAAKKKKHGKNSKLAAAIVKIICILLAVCVVLYFIGSMLTNIFYVPQKVLTVAEYGDYKVSVAEYNYFYMSLFNQAANTADQYESYYSGMGAQYFDSTKDPAAQTCQETDLPEGVSTWADYFKHCAPERAILVKMFYDKAMSEEAKAAGFALSEEDKTTIKDVLDQTMDSYREQANASDFAMDNYLSKTFGEGVTEKLFRELLEKEYVAELYIEWYQKDASDNVTTADAEAYYLEHRDDYDTASFRVFAVSYAEESENDDPVYTKEEAKKRIDEFKSKLTDDASFVATAVEYAPESQKTSYADDSATLVSDMTKANITTLSEDMANWIFDTKRVAGETSVFDIESNELYYIVMMKSPASRDVKPTSVDVRHILFEAATTTTVGDEEVALPAETIALNEKNALAEAEAVKATWEKNGATEDAFIELVAANTDDPGSKETGGLYEDINSTSSYVPEFKSWALDTSRKPGDVEIVKTSYGYHLMYYVEGDMTQKWESDVRNTISTEKANELTVETVEQIRTGIARSTSVCDFFTERTEKILDNIVKQNAAASAYTYQ